MTDNSLIDIKQLVNDTLINTFVMVFGNAPDEGGFSPDETTLAVLEQMFDNNPTRIRRYSCDVMLAYVWSMKKTDSRVPFFVNTRLVSPQMISFVKDHRGFLRTVYGSLLSEPDNYFNAIYAGVYETEIDYLNIAAECHFRDLELDWEIITPTLPWYLMAVSGVKEIPCGRIDPEKAPPRWAKTLVRFEGVDVPISQALGGMRKDLRNASTRRVFVQAAERAMYDATFQWCVRYRLIRAYRNSAGKPAIATKFSSLKSNDLMLSFPLVDRDKAFFTIAKKALVDSGFVFEPLPEYEELCTDPEEQNEGEGLNVSGATIRGGKSLNGALASATQNADE